MARDKIRPGRREFVKKAAYVPPAILSLAAAPHFAKAGSVKKEKEEKEEKEKDKEIKEEKV